MDLRALFLVSALGLALLSGACAQSTRSTYTTAWVNVTQPVTVLTGIPFDLTLDLPALLPFASANGEPQPWPDRLGVVVRDPGDPTGALLLNTTLATTRLELIAANFSGFFFLFFFAFQAISRTINRSTRRHTPHI